MTDDEPKTDPTNSKPEDDKPKKKGMSKKTRKTIATVVLVVGTATAAIVGGPWAKAILFGTEVASEAIKDGGKKSKVEIEEPKTETVEEPEPKTDTP